MKTSGRILLVVTLLAACAVPALAQEDDTGSGSTTAATLSRFGLRAGYTSWKSTDQFHFGAHYLAGEIVPNIEFTPNVEIGVGSDLTVVTINGDVAYRFTEFFERPWGVYGGGSLSFNYFDVNGVGSDTDLGLSLLAGGTYDFPSGRQGMAEIRVGVLDSPDLKLTFGITLF